MGHDLLAFYANERWKRRAYLVLCHLSHLAAGCVTALAAASCPPLAALLFLSFIIYELDEDWHLSDGAYKDIFVYALGLYATAILLVV